MICKTKNVKKVFLVFSIVLLNAYYLQPADILESKKIIISDNLELTKLNRNVWIHTSYINLSQFGRTPANGLLVIDDKKAVLIDTPWNNELTHELIEWIKSNLDIEIKYLVINHFHEDCMGGIKEAHNQGIESYALNLTAEIAKEKGLIIPKKTFKDSITIKINNTELVAKFMGAGHTVDNIVVWLPGYKILFGGCLVKSLPSKNLGNLEDADLKSWPKTLKKVYTEFKEAEIVVPGHGMYGGVELIVHSIELCGMR